MGSLKVLYPTALKQKNKVAVFQIRKPTVILVVVKKSFDPNHSPLGSPPTEKKRIRRYSNSLQMSKSQAAGNGVQYAEEKENDESPPSILKLSPVRPRGLLTQGSPTRCSHKRHVNFNGQVKVQYIGDTDTSFEPLNTENSDRQRFIARNAMHRKQVQLQQPAFPVYKDNQSVATSSSSHHSHPFAPEQSSASTGIPQASASSINLPAVLNSSNSPLQNKNANISFSQTGRNGSVTMQHFAVFMGPQYDPANVVVKANICGTWLRVVASLKPARGGTSEQYNKCFQLPMQVDPYKVEARLDAQGFLTVTAPLLEPSLTSVSV